MGFFLCSCHRLLIGWCEQSLLSGAIRNILKLCSCVYFPWGINVWSMGYPHDWDIQALMNMFPGTLSWDILVPSLLGRDSLMSPSRALHRYWCDTSQTFAVAFLCIFWFSSLKILAGTKNNGKNKLPDVVLMSVLCLSRKYAWVQLKWPFADTFLAYIWFVFLKLIPFGKSWILVMEFLESLKMHHLLE